MASQDKKATRTAVAVRHVLFEDLGTFADVLADRGFAITYVEAGRDDLAAVDVLAPDLWVSLGGPIGVGDIRDYPYLSDEIAALEKRLAAGRPTLGLCLGAQLMAKALGADVYPGPAKEIGWSPLFLSGRGQTSCVRHVGGEHTFMMHWHGDTFDLPADAVLHASTEVCRHQVFTWGEAALAFQCHPEFRAADIERWLIGHAVEIAAAAGVSVRKVRDDTARYGATLERQGRLCFEQWLDQVTGLPEAV